MAAMTPARLREIAERVESVCREKRMLIENFDAPCDGCKAAGRELRELADGWEQIQVRFRSTGAQPMQAMSEAELIELEHELDRLSDCQIIADEVRELEDALDHVENKAGDLRRKLESLRGFQSKEGFRRLIAMARSNHGAKAV